MKWLVILSTFVAGFAVGVLCMDIVAIKAMRGHLTGYLLEQVLQEDTKASSAACGGDVVEESLRRWSVAAFGLERAVPYIRRHESLADPFLAALSAHLGAAAYDQAATMDDLYRAKLIEALVRAEHPELADRLRAELAGRGKDTGELEQLAQRLIETDCKPSIAAP